MNTSMPQGVYFWVSSEAFVPALGMTLWSFSDLISCAQALRAKARRRRQQRRRKELNIELALPVHMKKNLSPDELRVQLQEFDPSKVKSRVMIVERRYAVFVGLAWMLFGLAVLVWTLVGSEDEPCSICTETPQSGFRLCRLGVGQECAFAHHSSEVIASIVLIGVGVAERCSLRNAVFEQLHLAPRLLGQDPVKMRPACFRLLPIERAMPQVAIFCGSANTVLGADLMLQQDEEHRLGVANWQVFTSARIKQKVMLSILLAAQRVSFKLSWDDFRQILHLMPFDARHCAKGASVVPAWTAGIVRRILCEAERCHVCLVHGSCSFPSPSACASELYFVALWLPGSGCFAPFFTRHCRGGSVFMGQVQGSHDVLVESLLQLPPQWLQLIRQALDQVERAQGSSWSWAAPPSEANVDTRHWGQATDAGHCLDKLKMESLDDFVNMRLRTLGYDFALQRTVQSKRSPAKVVAAAVGEERALIGPRSHLQSRVLPTSVGTCHGAVEWRSLIDHDAETLRRFREAKDITLGEVHDGLASGPFTKSQLDHIFGQCKDNKDSLSDDLRNSPLLVYTGASSESEPAEMDCQGLAWDVLLFGDNQSVCAGVAKELHETYLVFLYRRPFCVGMKRWICPKVVWVLNWLTVCTVLARWIQRLQGLRAELSDRGKGTSRDAPSFEFDG
ncbi:Ferredoxin [Symbiodinium sp. KB8]|nr:Ferredoxin [Symbiodinium sp. KB8]